LETRWTWTYVPTIVYLGYALILGSMVGAGETSAFMQRLLRHLVFRVVAFIGFFSYSIYLWHWDLGLGGAKLINRLLGENNYQAGGHPLTFTIPAVVMFATFAIVTGILLGRLIETPTLRLRDKLLPRRVSALEVSSQAAGDAPPEVAHP
jgi:peptidoglycan/LPS O-acetylase OafA/YrhL